ncbi:SMI1 / KNR4 family (SUKH-1) [Neorhodopirellula lusitana]|uniref:SMI1 / KNR4 family (SUKH-1) n=1 Tax=Neorhodopirellula lusitana TaxID=445327 RepID=A0ABY1QRB4_9BACT|nr:SMI1/KNR4 family protein [Neorhodopirellula lusitana]SMP75597.1 SMI1 / KNR4 family (SUKH-1) [Neorhodopirellula lusitana]
MNKTDLTAIQQELAITLPAAYRNLIEQRAAEIQDAGCFEEHLSPLFINSERVIQCNEMQREKDAGTEYVFPLWWETYFLIGTNGGGDYYCLRLDNEPGVWMIGADCGDVATLIVPTLDQFVDQLLADHVTEVQRQADLDRSRLGFQLENAAHRRAAAGKSDAKNSDEWFDEHRVRSLFRIIDRLPHKVSPRKLRLYGIACCKLIPALKEGAHCTAAIELAERMTLGEASEDARVAMEALLRVEVERTVKMSNPLRWRPTAVHGLFQSDEDYLRDTPIYPRDPSLAKVYFATSYALHGSPNGSDLEANLLREVLGNPFMPVDFEPHWRTDQVRALAENMFESQDFTKMPALAEALAAAGCDDSRILSHCQRESGHVRGCWVVDLILEKEPDPSRRELPWDFRCHHPRIDAKALKARLEQFGTLGSPPRSLDSFPAAFEEPSNRGADPALQLFADWLEENSDPNWADYIRIRSVLDERPPGDDYIDLFERQFECAAGMQTKLLDLDNLYFSGYQFAQDAWWGSETDHFQRGLPSDILAVSPGQDAGPPEQLIARLQSMVQKTPLRGVDFQEYFADSMLQILNSLAGRELNGIAFQNQLRSGMTSPAIPALASLSHAPRIERLRIQGGIKSDNDALNLAAAPLNHLRRLDMQYGAINCSKDAADQLMTSTWFSQLGQLYCGIGEDCAETAAQHLSQMPQLHSLGLSRPPRQTLIALSNAEEFQSLSRLYLHGADLTGEACQAMCTLKAPKLIDLWLSKCVAKAADLRALLTSPLFDHLRAVTFAGPRLNERSLHLLAQSNCASQLRILRLHCGDSRCIGTFKSLGSTVLADDAFPSLTTLTISHPFSKKAKHDTAVLLRRLNAPNLRHLTLEDCEFDDECAAAIGENPSFANLTRLSLSQVYAPDSPVSPKRIETMIRSNNLKNVVELKLRQIALGDEVKMFADETVLPRLKSAAIGGSKSSNEAAAFVKSARPIVYVN